MTYLGVVQVALGILYECRHLVGCDPVVEEERSKCEEQAVVVHPCELTDGEHNGIWSDIGLNSVTRATHDPPATAQVSATLVVPARTWQIHFR
jgi:hypothetical protein